MPGQDEKADAYVGRNGRWSAAKETKMLRILASR
jgi:hypothetical protein